MSAAATAGPVGVEPDRLPVGARWVDVSTTAPVVFPFDGTPVGDAPVGDAALATRAVDEAVAVRDDLARVPSHVRRTVLTAVHDGLADEQDALADLLVLETGKPLVDCRVEVARTLVTWQAAADHVAALHGETVPLDVQPSGEGLIGYWTRRPIGVVVGIAGFNYPLLLASHKIAPALAAGCPIVLKPAPQTPLTTLRLARIVRDALSAADVPPAAVQVVTGGPDVGVALTTDRRVAAVSFTGSADVGHAIARAAAPAKVLLELGSNAALIVARDADLDAAADAVRRGGFYASGQACISVQRVVVEAGVAADLLDRLTARLSEVTVGDPRDPSTRVSALIDAAATARVTEWIGAAVTAGARLVAGGGTDDAGVLQPTVLADVPEGVDAWDQEMFGPVVCVRAVPDLDTAIDVVNRSRYGLHASVFTASLDVAFAAIDRLEAGGVLVNEVPGFRSDIMPYGGVKDSGIGREGPRFAIEELTVTRMAVIRPRTGNPS